MKKKLEYELTNSSFKMLQKVLKEGKRSVMQQTDMRDVKLRLRMAMLDDFGREVCLDLPSLAHAEM